MRGLRKALDLDDFIREIGRRQKSFDLQQKFEIWEYHYKKDLEWINFGWFH